MQRQALPVLSKDEAYRFVEALGFPKTGPFLGVAWWAAGIGRSRFNFDFDFDRDDLSILNAYDRFPATGLFRSWPAGVLVSGPV